MQYLKDRDKLFTEQGLVAVLLIEKLARQHISKAGAMQAEKVMGAAGDTFFALNALDFLVKVDILRVVTSPDTFGQDRVYVAGSAF